MLAETRKSVPKMYIYDLPYEINRDLCRLLDNDDVWKELAGNMSYNAFEVNVSQLLFLHVGFPQKQVGITESRSSHPF